MAKLTITRAHGQLPQMARKEVPPFAVIIRDGIDQQLINLGNFDGKSMSLNVVNGGLYIARGDMIDAMVRVCGYVEPRAELIEDPTQEQTMETMVPTTAFTDGSVGDNGKHRLFCLLGFSEEVGRSHIALNLDTNEVIQVPKKHKGLVVGRVTFEGKAA